MALTHRQMVQEALGNQEVNTNAEVQEYIHDFLGTLLSTGEISDLRYGLAWTRPACEISQEESASLNTFYSGVEA